MLKNSFIILCLFLMSCINSEPKQTYKLFYEFVNNAQLSEKDRGKTVEVLIRRLKKFSSDFDVSLTNDKKIKILVKTSLDENRLNSLITNQGKLEFWELYKIDNLFNFLGEADKIVTESQIDSVSAKSIVEYISSMGHQNSSVLFFAKSEDTVVVNERILKFHTRALLPEEYSYSKFIWGIPYNNEELPLYVAKSNRDDKAFITAEHIIDARQGYNAIGRPTIIVQMNELGSKRWERMTETAFNQQTCIAISLNDLVYSAPGVTTGPIRGGNFEISGDFTLEEAVDLSIILSSSHSIPKLQLLQSSIMD